MNRNSATSDYVAFLRIEKHVSGMQRVNSQPQRDNPEPRISVTAILCGEYNLHI